MILPEDTKAPITSDDEDFEDDFASLPPSPPLPFHALSNTDQYGPLNLDYPSSPNSTLTHPLLLHSEDDDIELGPAPPYTPVDPRRRSDRKGELRKRYGKRFAMGAAGVMGVWVGLMGISALGWKVWGRDHDRFRPPPGGGGGGGGNQDQQPPTDGSANDEVDGHTIECAVFTSDTPWAIFPASDDQPHLPQPLSEDQGSRRSINTTFILPTIDDYEIFTHLLVGPAAVGDFFVSTYDATSDDMYAEIKQEGVIIGKTENGDELKKGEYVRVVVETIYDVLPNIGHEPASSDNSPGWEMLMRSKLCLMERQPGNGTDGPPFDHDGPDGPGGPMEKRGNEEDRRPPGPPPGSNGVGVGIVTARPSDTHFPNNASSPPLRFRLHIAVPTVSDTTTTRSLVESVLDALPLAAPGPSGPEHRPRNHVRSLQLKGAATSMYLGNLNGDISIGELNAVSAVGEIIVENLRAEKVDLTTAGKIDAKVAISTALNVNSPLGDIDLDITIASTPDYSIMPPSGPPGGHNSTHEKDLMAPPSHHGGGSDACSSPPLNVNVQSGTDSTVIRYTGWEDACRGLSQEVVSLVGAVKIYSHPLFQGLYHLSTAMGQINVDRSNTDIPDPQGLGRDRNITLEKQDLLGSKHWSGSVTWEEHSESQGSIDAVAEDEMNKEKEDSEDSLEVKDLNNVLGERSQESASKSRPPGGGPPHGRKSEKTLDVKTSVGSITVVF